MKREGHKENQVDVAEAALQQADAAEWARMSDVQRAQWCLRCTRLLDNDQFRRDFGSWNGPDPDMAFTNPISPGKEKI